MWKTQSKITAKREGKLTGRRLFFCPRVASSIDQAVLTWQVSKTKENMGSGCEVRIPKWWLWLPTGGLCSFERVPLLENNSSKNLQKKKIPKNKSQTQKPLDLKIFTALTEALFPRTWKTGCWSSSEVQLRLFLPSWCPVRHRAELGCPGLAHGPVPSAGGLTGTTSPAGCWAGKGAGRLCSAGHTQNSARG